jgi:hypothetical protein
MCKLRESYESGDAKVDIEQPELHPVWVAATVQNINTHICVLDKHSAFFKHSSMRISGESAWQ